MVEVNWDDVPDGNDYSPLPDGQYTCILEKVEERQGSKGEYWSLEFRVLNGDYSGRKIYDSVFFTPKALPRFKLIASRLGHKTEGTSQITPDMIKGSIVKLTVFTEKYMGKDNRERTKNTIPYDGYEQIEGKINTKDDDSDLPF